MIDNIKESPIAVAILLCVLAGLAFYFVMRAQKNDVQTKVTTVKFLKKKDNIEFKKTLKLPKYIVSKRDPFSKISEETALTVIVQTGTQTPLTKYSLQEYRYLGMIQLGKKIWGVVETPDGEVYRVMIGSSLGKGAGRVNSIAKNSLKVNQTVTRGSRQKLMKTVTLRVLET